MTYSYAVGCLLPKLTLKIGIILLSCAAALAQVRPRGLDAYPEWQSQPTTEQATSEAAITPLQIGDAIPEALWQLPLQVINHPEGKETITLNDYRGKLILLDFWGIGCGSCIVSLPKLDFVQQQFPDDIAVLPTAQGDTESISNFWQRNKYTRTLQIPSIADKQFLHQYFPHSSISHIVWISTDGYLYSTSHPTTVTPTNIQHALSGQTARWQPKIDHAYVEHPQELLIPALKSQATTNPRSQQPYYTSLLGYFPDIPQTSRQTPDSLSGTKLFTYTNRSLYHLILMSLRKSRATLKPSQVIWHVNDRNRYTMDTQNGDVEGWKQANYYSYQSRMPIHTTMADFRESLQQDLKRFFPSLHFQLDKKRHTCYSLVAIDDLSAIATKGGAPMVLSGDELPVKSIRNQRISLLVQLLNAHFDGSPVFDETDYTASIDITLPVADLSDIVSVRRALRKQGLDLIEVTRSIEMLTIADQPHTFKTN